MIKALHRRGGLSRSAAAASPIRQMPGEVASITSMGPRHMPGGNANQPIRAPPFFGEPTGWKCHRRFLISLVEIFRNGPLFGQ